ncbi:unnamed protein product [Didymodactylos carnosus]|uniref:Uncharacterized protein n=1 Tax=Didymodactylos carnosus TaxID=1234261 RepID=A0A815KJL0_9BILA|nr:unnamed protein product [Didymodactylos carnosus]CAF1396512.1 unnamed protein product [Didymodactylos carnosus]CAF4090556.1 unnamed protein product [Didymodactylos carnosus]CAF4290703.1 unnamed protein product [Didymodactylos carnosus]
MRTDVSNLDSWAISQALTSNTCAPYLFLNGALRYYSNTDIKQILESLIENKTVTNFCIQRNQISNENAKLLAQILKSNKTLVGLNLISNELTADGIDSFVDALNQDKNSSSLTALTLSDNSNISDETIAKLIKTGKKLTILDLSNNNIVDGNGLIPKALIINQNLLYLNLFNNKLSPLAKNEIKRCIESRPNLIINL